MLSRSYLIYLTKTFGSINKILGRVKKTIQAKFQANDEMLYRVTNKNHHGKTWSIRQPMLLRLLICRSIIFMRFITWPETICSHLRDPGEL